MLQKLEKITFYLTGSVAEVAPVPQRSEASISVLLPKQHSESRTKQVM